MKNKFSLLTIGVPVRNEEENIPILIETLEKLRAELFSLNVELEILVNENCSLDNSLHLLNQWADVAKYVTVYQLKFPVSFQESILRMMEEAQGDAFVVFQSDLQDPMEVVIEFVQQWKNGASIVAGVAVRRSEGRLDRVTRKIFYWLLQRFSDGNFIPGFQDFYLVSKPVYLQLTNLPKHSAFIRGHISSGFGQVFKVEYERHPRLHGSSNFDFAAKYALALDGLLLFGTKFVRLISVFSFGVFGVSLLATVTLIIMHFGGINFGTQGWASQVVVMLSVLSLFGLVSGLILEYLIRIYRILVFTED
jgi:dolichol-phosphate mannosyltransferase